jgi:phasin
MVSVESLGAARAALRHFAPAAPFLNSANTDFHRSQPVNDFARQTQEFFSAAKEARIPEQVQAIAEDSVSKARESYGKLNTVAKDSVKVMEDVMVAAHAGAKSIGDKVLKNTETNTEAVFEAAQALARAKTLPELLRLQTSFVQQQMAAAGAQSKELFELSTKVAQQTFESLNTAATKTFEQMKKAG